MSSSCIPLSGRVQKDPVTCPQCGSGSRVKRGLCLSCLLSQGLPEETSTETSQNSEGHTAETLEDVLSEIDVRDAGWRLGNYQILEEIARGAIRTYQRHPASRSETGEYSARWTRRTVGERFRSGHMA